MSIFDGAYRRVSGAFARIFKTSRAALSAFLGRFFYAIFNTRPGLKRGVLVFLLFAVMAVPAHVLIGSGALVASLMWALALLALFWGMGAERAATEWSPVFALPPLTSFAFWHWHTLERKRFTAVLTALGAGLSISGLAEVLL